MYAGIAVMRAEKSSGIKMQSYVTERHFRWLFLDAIV